MTTHSNTRAPRSAEAEGIAALGAEKLREADPEGLYLCSLGKYPYMMSPKMVAEFLGATPQGVRKLLNEGCLKGTRCGSKWVVPQVNLLRYLYKHQN